MAGNKINWLNHFIEFIVVVVGILIAFQLNTCREVSNEQKLVQEHLRNIISETELNQKFLSVNIESSKNLLEKLDSTLTYIEAGRNTDTINRLSLGLLSVDYTYLKKNAYNSFVESGDIRFMSDFELQNDIVSVYEYYAWLEGIDASTRTTYSSQFFPYMVEHMDLINFRTQPIEIYTNKKFKNYLSVYRYALAYRLLKQEEVHELLSDFLESTSSYK